MKPLLCSAFLVITLAGFAAADSSTTVLNGGKLAMAATTTGTPAPSIQWQKDGVAISGATKASYEVPVVTTAHAGEYSVFVKNTLGASESNHISIVISTPAPGVPPVITKKPSDVTAPKKSDVVFKVEATGAKGYQWQKGGTNLVGKTTAVLELKRVMPESAGTYTVRVFNDFGSVTTSPGAKLTITR